MSTFNEASFTKRLQKLDIAEDSISSLASYMQFFPTSAQQMAKCWERVFKQEYRNKALVYVYLLHEVFKKSLPNSQVLKQFQDAFREPLLTAVTTLTIANHERLDKTMKTIRSWGKYNFIPPSYCESLILAYKNPDKSLLGVTPPMSAPAEDADLVTSKMELPLRADGTIDERAFTSQAVLSDIPMSPMTCLHDMLYSSDSSSFNPEATVGDVVHVVSGKEVVSASHPTYSVLLKDIVPILPSSPKELVKEIKSLDSNVTSLLQLITDAQANEVKLSFERSSFRENEIKDLIDRLFCESIDETGDKEGQKESESGSLKGEIVTESELQRLYESLSKYIKTLNDERNIRTDLLTRASDILAADSEILGKVLGNSLFSNGVGEKESDKSDLDMVTPTFSDEEILKSLADFGDAYVVARKRTREHLAELQRKKKESMEISSAIIRNAMQDAESVKQATPPRFSAPFELSGQSRSRRDSPQRSRSHGPRPYGHDRHSGHRPAYAHSHDPSRYHEQVPVRHGEPPMRHLDRPPYNPPRSHHYNPHPLPGPVAPRDVTGFGAIYNPGASRNYTQAMPTHRQEHWENPYAGSIYSDPNSQYQRGPPVGRPPQFNPRQEVDTRRYPGDEGYSGPRSGRTP